MSGRKHPLAECEVCPYQKGTAYVPSQFPRRPIKLAVVGEAPGQQEAKTGVPFTGPSGELLDAVLAHHGVNRNEVLLTNICSCRPFGPTEAPPKEAIKACSARFEHEIDKSGAPLILALGNTAAKATIDDGRTITHVRVGPPKPYINNPNLSVIATWHPAYCVAPNTRILRSDLCWIKAEEIEIGDELIGFNENKSGVAYEQRRLEPSIVTDKTKAVLPCYELTMEDGRTIVCSYDHKWLATVTNGKYWRNFDWMYTGHMTRLKGVRIAHYLEPWEQIDTREAGYIAGFMDGEGYVSGSQAAWSQNDGPTSDYMLKLVEGFGFDITKSDVHGSNCKRFHFKGKRDSLTALGMFRPERLIKNARKLWDGKKANYGSVAIKSVKNVGEREVVVLTTTTRTYIAEGLLSHNCLRNPDAFPSFVDDVEKWNKPHLTNWQPPEYRVFEDPTSAEIALNRLAEKAEEIVIDIEVGVEKDFDYVHPEDYDLLCVGIAYASKKAIVIGENALLHINVREALGRLLRKVKLIGHNLRFDLRGLSPRIGVMKQYFDTMLASYAVDERPRQHGLKVLAVEKLGAPKYDDEIKQYIPRGGSYANIPRPILYRYNAYDVGCTWDLKDFFIVKLGEQRRVHDFMIAASNELIHLDLAGITIDLAYNKELAKEFQADIEELEKQLNDVVGYVINPRSVPQVTRYLTGRGLIISTTNREFLEELLKNKNLKTDVREFVTLLLEHRKVSKLYGTYVKKLPDKLHNGKIHTSYLLHATSSGRLASRSDNLQNIARDKRIKNQYTVESPDNILIQADYKQNEGRTICALAGDGYLRNIFNDPTRDIFDEMCNDIFGVGNWNKEDRVRVKSVFYGLAYGRGIESIATELDMSWDAADELIRNFKSLIPATVAWQNDVISKVLSGEDLITPFGRKRAFHLITNENKHSVINEALSYLPQSIASDICLTALISLRPKLAEIDAVMRLTVHDSLVVECHQDIADQVEDLMRREMIAAGRSFTTYVNYAVDVSQAKRYGELS